MALPRAHTKRNTPFTCRTLRPLVSRHRCAQVPLTLLTLIIRSTQITLIWNMVFTAIHEPFQQYDAMIHVLRFHSSHTARCKPAEKWRPRCKHDDSTRETRSYKSYSYFSRARVFSWFSVFLDTNVCFLPCSHSQYFLESGPNNREATWPIHPWYHGRRGRQSWLR